MKERDTSVIVGEAMAKSVMWLIPAGVCWDLGWHWGAYACLAVSGFLAFCAATVIVCSAFLFFRARLK